MFNKKSLSVQVFWGFTFLFGAVVANDDEKSIQATIENRAGEWKEYRIPTSAAQVKHFMNIYSVIFPVDDYMIEGSQQKEEMVFKMEINQLLVKKGELEEVGDMLKLKDPDTANFSEVIPRVICR